MLRLKIAVMVACLGLMSQIGAGAQTQQPSVAVAGGGTINTCINEIVTVGFSASVTGAPTATQECTITGPTWNWSASPGDMSSSGAGASVAISFPSPGDYTVTATASVVYTSSCGTQYSGSGSGSTTVHVVAPVWTVTNRQPAQFNGWKCSNGLTLNTTPGTFTNTLKCQYDSTAIQTINGTSDWYIVNAWQQTDGQGNTYTEYEIEEIGSDGTVFQQQNVTPNICCPAS